MSAEKYVVPADLGDISKYSLIRSPLKVSRVVPRKDGLEAGVCFLELTFKELQYLQMLLEHADGPTSQALGGDVERLQSTYHMLKERQDNLTNAPPSTNPFNKFFKYRETRSFSTAAHNLLSVSALDSQAKSEEYDGIITIPRDSTEHVESVGIQVTRDDPNERLSAEEAHLLSEATHYARVDPSGHIDQRERNSIESVATFVTCPPIPPEKTQGDLSLQHHEGSTLQRDATSTASSPPHLNRIQGPLQPYIHAHNLRNTSATRGDNDSPQTEVSAFTSPSASDQATPMGHLYNLHVYNFHVPYPSESPQGALSQSGITFNQVSGSGHVVGVYWRFQQQGIIVQYPSNTIRDGTSVASLTSDR
ncbi:hypothetical protein CONPUDRAFT_141538 [Coniophora puteana RWD-64-598 SS2]|uniref:Uncharacterized protein n=1 Tax=Coniophora puteana (strain RWD-64-598) TaxID=741705 RepID=A0A5M3N7K2_CONPW|nr:uncharacterized protein CONPUDRAFT_141538 [Coniophora puteana RWD-64-598 SS2]EIW87430.1 hypothetical protein CONPUDRAFT_141538 [Coniophora puteana RWD-64-598 SS2]